MTNAFLIGLMFTFRNQQHFAHSKDPKLLKQLNLVLQLENGVTKVTKVTNQDKDEPLSGSWILTDLDASFWYDMDLQDLFDTLDMLLASSIPEEPRANIDHPA